MARVLLEYDAIWLTLAAWAIIVLFGYVDLLPLRAQRWLVPVFLIATQAAFVRVFVRSMRWRRGDGLVPCILLWTAAGFGMLSSFAAALAWYVCCP